MKVLGWLSCALFTATAVFAETRQAPEELEIVTTFMPAECPHKAKTGDSIQVHYVRLSVLGDEDFLKEKSTDWYPL